MPTGTGSLLVTKFVCTADARHPRIAHGHMQSLLVTRFVCAADARHLRLHVHAGCPSYPGCGATRSEQQLFPDHEQQPAAACEPEPPAAHCDWAAEGRPHSHGPSSRPPAGALSLHACLLCFPLMPCGAENALLRLQLATGHKGFPPGGRGVGGGHEQSFLEITSSCMSEPHNLLSRVSSAANTVSHQDSSQARTMLV